MMRLGGCGSKWCGLLGVAERMWRGVVVRRLWLRQRWREPARSRIAHLPLRLHQVPTQPVPAQHHGKLVGCRHSRLRQPGLCGRSSGNAAACPCWAISANTAVGRCIVSSTWRGSFCTDPIGSGAHGGACGANGRRTSDRRRPSNVIAVAAHRDTVAVANACVAIFMAGVGVPTVGEQQRTPHARQQAVA
eukprot:285143-Chlamydomonas_euryale.AAC.1